MTKHPDHHGTPETPLESRDRTRGRRRAGVAAGLSAGLVGGALAGVTLGSAGLSSAAGNTAAPLAIVQQVDDETPAPDTDTGADDRRARAGERIADALQPLVDDGTLTAEQVDAVSDRLVEVGAERHGDRLERRGNRLDRRIARADAVAEVLGMDVDELRAELRDGQTLAEIAEASGVDIQEVIDVMVEQAAQRLDAAVEAGRLTDDEAADRLAAITERLTDHLAGS
ncbi:MAG: hypothetical protein AAFP84_03640 [Actinomycetota bacterium]